MEAFDIKLSALSQQGCMTKIIYRSTENIDYSVILHVTLDGKIQSNQCISGHIQQACRDSVMLSHGQFVNIVFTR